MAAIRVHTARVEERHNISRKQTVQEARCEVLTECMLLECCICEDVQRGKWSNLQSMLSSRMQYCDSMQHKLQAKLIMTGTSVK